MIINKTIGINEPIDVATPIKDIIELRKLVGDCSEHITLIKLRSELYPAMNIPKVIPNIAAGNLKNDPSEKMMIPIKESTPADKEAFFLPNKSATKPIVIWRNAHANG